MRRATRSQAGFTTIEAIVAMAIASLVLATLYRTVSYALRAASRVQVHETALVLARSQLAALGSDGRLQSGTFRGAYENGYTWKLTVTVLTSSRTDAEDALRPYWLVLESYDAQGVAILSLQTAKLAKEVQ